LDADLSSSEESALGNYLESLAIHISEKENGGHKSGIEGIDLEFTRSGIRYFVSIKSGPNWGNSQQIKRMKSNFTQAQKTARTSGGNDHIECVEGCCYGKENFDRGDYKKMCGQAFWEFISEEADLYKRIIEPFGFNAREKNDEFKRLYSETINNFTGKFHQEFVSAGNIDWGKLVEFNSSKTG
jgi:hypothetical protein